MLLVEIHGKWTNLSKPNIKPRIENVLSNSGKNGMSDSCAYQATFDRLRIPISMLTKQKGNKKTIWRFLQVGGSHLPHGFQHENDYFDLQKSKCTHDLKHPDPRYIAEVEKGQETKNLLRRSLYGGVVYDRS